MRGSLCDHFNVIYQYLSGETEEIHENPIRVDGPCGSIPRCWWKWSNASSCSYIFYLILAVSANQEGLINHSFRSQVVSLNSLFIAWFVCLRVFFCYFNCAFDRAVSTVIMRLTFLKSPFRISTASLNLMVLIGLLSPYRWTLGCARRKLRQIFLVPVFIHP